jgi:8-oxo-dGTP pyrophosphatase MutT (NUDIX family)
MQDKSRNITEVIIYNDKNEVLMQKKTIDYPIYPGGIWCFFGGVIKDGEEPIDAAKREVKEETNLDIKDIELISVNDYLFNNKPSKKYVYKAKFFGNISDIRVSEGAGFSFFNEKELSKYPIAYEDIVVVNNYFKNEIFKKR